MKTLISKIRRKFIINEYIKNKEFIYEEQKALAHSVAIMCVCAMKGFLLLFLGEWRVGKGLDNNKGSQNIK